MNESLETIDARAASLIHFHEDLIQDLIRIRKSHNLTQETVAERMGVTQAAVSQFERYDSNPKLATVRRYALAVGARITHEVVDDWQI
ncbi:helix-turn-helix domain-containing protein [Tessaracoccus caeni]|uniref:helix-turn-helix domain-containing protein n=1 Tax=Tessaracoccus caeni TaxID=3031239 RepID=UPI0023DC4316|nr:helix-turn-helix transcriptional regulator [Tessaracoccus caeni]MDF1489863.1 helix-turn-helix transcriptional regulator [Tessaracoccus caeni]